MTQFDLQSTTLYHCPKVFTNKTGEPIIINLLNGRQHEALTRMYLSFEPRPCFNDLPPRCDETCEQWVRNVIEDGVNITANCLDNGIVGHAAIFPMNARRCEMLLAVTPDHQLCGIGTQLIHTIVQLAFEINFHEVWLTVSTTNFVAKHLYRKCGFKFQPTSDFDAVEMLLDLQQYHISSKISVAMVMNRNAVAVHGDTPCSEVIELFLKKNIAALPVVNDKQQVIGVISEADLIIATNATRTAKEVATRMFVSTHDTSTLDQAIRLLQSSQIRCIPVLDHEHKLAGVLGRKDILAYYYTHYTKKD